MTWPKKIDKDNDKDKDIWEHLLRAILETCDIWDTDYNSDKWGPEFMKIFATWQLRVTLDSIRNSCDVYKMFNVNWKWKDNLFALNEALSSEMRFWLLRRFVTDDLHESR